MKFKARRHGTHRGYTLVELMMVMVILTIVVSVTLPRFNILLQKAAQAKAKSNLGFLRSAFGIYYSDNEGHWPLFAAPMNNYGWMVGVSIRETIVPRYMQKLPPAHLADNAGSFNGLAAKYDLMALAAMEPDPAHDVFLTSGPARYHPLIAAPWAYDPSTGLVYYCNGNFDRAGNYFYDW